MTPERQKRRATQAVSRVQGINRTRYIPKRVGLNAQTAVAFE